MTALFVFLWLFVGATSSVDACLTVKYAHVMEEENPLANLLIVYRPNAFLPMGYEADVSLLIAVKMFGTLLALGVLVLLYWRWRKGAQAVVAGLAALQVLLLFYLFQ
jgi:hypothetical protein